MSLLLQLHSIKCLDETNEAGSDEPYVLVTVANLRPALPGIPAIPNFRVFRYGIFDDMDQHEQRLAGGQPLWGIDGTPADIQNPNDVGIVVSLMENDNGTPEQYSELLNTRAGVSLAASVGDPSPVSRAARLTSDLRDVLNAIDVPIPFNFDDDHVGTQQLRLDSSDLLNAGVKDKKMIIEGDGGKYELVFRISFRGWQHSVPSAGQTQVLPDTSPTSWYSTPENVQHVAYVGVDQQIHECFFFVGPSGSWLHNIPSAGQVKVLQGTSPTSWYTTPENIQHIAYVGVDQQIHECYFVVGAGGGWLHSIPSAGQIKVLPGTSPTSWYTTPENVQHIAYVGVDQQIHECYFFVGAGGGWLHSMPSAGQVKVRSGTSPTSWYTTPENIQHIAYVGVDEQIHECFFVIGAGGGWLHSIPSAGQVKVAARSSPTSWYTTPENVQHIAYVGVDQQVHECFFVIDAGGGWLHSVPSAGRAQVEAGSSPTSWYTTPENVQHIAYVGVDQQIHECFYFIAGGAWLHNMPSLGHIQVAGGTSPTSWYTTPENVQHIAYVGTDQEIHECFFFIH